MCSGTNLTEAATALKLSYFSTNLTSESTAFAQMGNGLKWSDKGGFVVIFLDQEQMLKLEGVLGDALTPGWLARLTDWSVSGAITCVVTVLLATSDE